MKRKIVALVFAGLLLTLMFSVAPMKTSAVVPVQTHTYIVMEGTLTCCVSLAIFPATYWRMPFPTRLAGPYFTPQQIIEDITFLPPQNTPVPGYWIVPISVNKTTFQGFNHIFYYPDPKLGYVRITTFIHPLLPCFGFIHIGPAAGAICNVDYDVFNNYSGVFFKGMDGIPGTADDVLATNYTNPLNPLINTATFGLDGVPGTPDDIPGTWGWVGGVLTPPDPPGSSILIVPLMQKMDQWNGTAWIPPVLAGGPAPPVPNWLIMTTASATDTVWQPPIWTPWGWENCTLHGNSTTRVGSPWEFVHTNPYLWTNVTKEPKANVWVKYACVWSLLTNFPAGSGIDILYAVTEKKVRQDQVIMDINCDNNVTILDVCVVTSAWRTVDEGSVAPAWYTPAMAAADLAKIGLPWVYGPGAQPPGPGGRWLYPVASPFATYYASTGIKAFDGRADVYPAGGDGVINICDLVRICTEFRRVIDP